MTLNWVLDFELNSIFSLFEAFRAIYCITLSNGIWNYNLNLASILSFLDQFIMTY